MKSLLIAMLCTISLQTIASSEENKKCVPYRGSEVCGVLVIENETSVTITDITFWGDVIKPSRKNARIVCSVLVDSEEVLEKTVVRKYYGRLNNMETTESEISSGKVRTLERLTCTK